jgi:MoxR-like ATPase
MNSLDERSNQAVPPLEPQIARVDAMRAALQTALIGQDDIIDDVLAAFLAGGHALVEGVPGLGKTLLVVALARVVGGTASRIQFTPDLMPTDVTGHAMYDLHRGEFRVRKGPVFAHLLLADEINRAPAKTQAALLEVMQERQVTIEGEAHRLPAPFMVLATQNPIEQEGTYPLPDAQLDRFLLKLVVDYPQERDEIEVIRRVTSGRLGDAFALDDIPIILDPEAARELQNTTAHLTVDDKIIAYAVALVRATRERRGLLVGAGSRGGIALVRVARAYALLDGRDFVVPDDIKRAALPVLRHRVVLSPELAVEGVSADVILDDLVESVPAPTN